MDNYRGLYKIPAKHNILGEAKRGEKRDIVLRQQKIKREATFLERRNIQEDVLTPGPAPRKEVDAKPKDSRREKLLRWKAEKERVQATLQKAKRPPFKAGVAHHALDPTKELAPPVRTTTAKCTTLKKNAATSRAVAAEKLKANPTTAAASLALLSAPVATSASSSATFSGRVTRSRTAAAAAATAESSSLLKREVKPKSNVTKSSAVTTLSSRTKAASTARAQSSKAVNTSAARSRTQVNTFTVTTVTSHPSTKGKISFAPKDHKFKAPTGLTLPTTPLTLKRKNTSKAKTWPQIAGVHFLSDSPSGQSPPKIQKSAKPTALQRKGRLSQAVKGKTLKKSPRTPKSGEGSLETGSSLSVRRMRSGPFIVTTFMPEPSVDVQVSPVQSTAGINRVQGEVQEDTVEMSDSTKMSPVRKKLQGTPGTSSTSKSVRSNGSSGRKKRSMSEKENMPEKNKSVVEEEWNMDIDAIDSMIVESGRMSIHEPSPPTLISPNNLATGMVPAQFSPYVTSARGKDKYSLQKRRSSLIPVSVSDVPPEELAKSKQIEHFRNLLERESSRLLTLCNVWEARKPEAPEKVQDVILGPVGQARLLVNDKFQQFKRLVDKFEIGESEGKITSDDLTGFWEMMLITVDNLGKRFKELEDLKANEWQEKGSDDQKQKVSDPSTMVSKPVPKPIKTQSRIRGIIDNIRKRRLESKQQAFNKSGNVATFDGGFFKVESPKQLLLPERVKSSPARTTTPLQFTRRSLLQQVLTNSAVRAQQSPCSSTLNRSLPLSPSPKFVAVQMRASELGRRISLGSSSEGKSCSSPLSSPVLKPEPTKSILKSDVQRRCRANTPRNRVAFQVSRRSDSFGLGSPSLKSSEGSPSTPTESFKFASPGSKKRASLIPRPISTPGRERASLLPVRESLAPSKPLPGGDLIVWDSPKSDLMARRSRRSNVSLQV